MHRQMRIFVVFKVRKMFGNAKFKVTEEVVINLPSFTQPRLVECRDSSYSNEL